MTSFRRPFSLLFTLPLLLLLSLHTANAQDTRQTSSDDHEPRLEQLRETFQQEYFRVGAVIQAVGDFVWDPPPEGRTNGFSISAARLSLRGTLDHGFSYLVQTDLTRTPGILDARVSYSFSPALALDAGLFKAPFSAELLIPAPGIDFVNRAQVVSALAPARQVGIALRGTTAEGLLGYSAGAFNGNGRRPGGNDNNAFLYTGRLVLMPQLSSGTLELGGNVAFSKDNLPAFSGERLLYGGDFRFTVARWLLSGEVISADLAPDAGEDRQVSGYQATLGYMLAPGRHQVLARWDAFSPDEDAADQDFVVLGYNFWPSSAFEIQVNYLVPMREEADFGDHQVLLNFQVAF